MFDSILVLTRRKKTGLGTHWGVQFPNGYVFDYVAGLDLRVTTLEQFADGEAVSIIKRIPWHLAATVRARLDELARNPRKYDLLSWNCETFAEWLTSGEPRSAQVLGTLMLIGIVALFAAAAK